MPELHRHVTSRTEDGVLVLTLNGPELRGEELTAAVREELIDAVDRAGATRVALDLRKVAFLTSLGIATLLLFRRHVRQKEGRLLLCGASEAVADVLLAAHVADASASSRIPFALAPDAAAAVAALNRMSLDG